MDKVWQVADRLDPDLWQHLLKLRGLDSEDLQDKFFHPTLDQLIAPADFPDMDKAVHSIRRAIEAGQSIAVWGDFDADGVTSTAILWETLHQLGAHVMPYIPNRESEGHGFSRAGLEKLAADGTRLIVTCDHGVTAFEDIAHAYQLGMEVIITDHHEPAHLLEASQQLDQSQADQKANDATAFHWPEAAAVIHPRRLAQPQPLAGCGVAYILAYAVWLLCKDGARHQPLDNDLLKAIQALDTSQARTEFADGRIELAAIGTIADLMPLTNHNRVTATLGLKALATTTRPGLQSLYKLADIQPRSSLTIYEVGFMVAPRLNAPGRLSDALDSLRLICSRSTDRASQLASTLHRLNHQRQDLLKEVVSQARQQLDSRPQLDAYVLSDPGWQAGVCGLAAGRLVEMVYRPIVVMQQQGEVARGSARSIPGFDFTAALTSIDDVLLSYGGHAMAAGFSAKLADLPEIEQRLGQLVRQQLSDDQLIPTVSIDAEVRLAELNDQLWQCLTMLEPCGMGNTQPLFAARNLDVIDARVMGGDGQHLKVTVQDQDQVPFEVVAFGFGHHHQALKGAAKLDVAFCLDENTWNGRRTLQLKAKDLKITA